MAAPAFIELARQAPMRPAQLPAPGVQSFGVADAAARAHLDRDPDGGSEHHNSLVPIGPQGPTTGPEIRPPGVPRTAFARVVAHYRSTWAGDQVVSPLGTHVEQRGTSAVQPASPDTQVPFAARRNTFRVPPDPVNPGVLGE